MFSPDHRVLNRRARMWLGILGIVSITGLLATTGSANFPPAWLQPAQYARAQSDTATPTVVPQPDAAPSPTVGLGEPPLTLHSAASAASAVVGQQLSFTTTLAAASVASHAVELRATIDSQLELLSTSGGSCSGGNALSCKLNVQRGQPATIVARVRVRPGAAPGSRLVYQALAQDDLSNTAASDQVIVMIATPSLAPTTPPAPSATPEQRIPTNSASTPAHPTTFPARRPARPASAAPLAATNLVAQPTATSSALTLPTMPAAIMHSSAGAATVAAPADGAAAADSWLELAPNLFAPAQALDPDVPALVVPAQEVLAQAPAAPADSPAAPIAIQQRQIIQLPNTTAAPPTAGLVALLLGLALTVHGLRRVRRAAAQLDRQGAALGRLAALVGTEAQRRMRMNAQAFESREE